MTSKPSGAAREQELVALANRVAILTFLTAFTIIAALVSLPVLLNAGADPASRALAALPVAGAVALLIAVRRGRARLRAAREGHRPPAPTATSRGDAALNTPR